MLIRVNFFPLCLLLVTQIDAKSSRRKGALRQPPELEQWTGNWFPFAPTIAPQSTTTQSTTTTTTTQLPVIASASTENSLDNWSGSWFPFKPTIPSQSTTTQSTTTTTTKLPTIAPASMENSLDNWSGNWFPFKPSYIPTVTPKPACDDGKHSIEIDFDLNDKRQSYNYLCLTSNRTRYAPDLSRVSIQIEHIVPPSYLPPVKCVNESISYQNDLPTFGGFRPSAPIYGSYRYLPPQRWLRGAAEGAIVMLYHPCAFPGQVTQLENALKSCMYRHLVTPSQMLSPERPLALLAWGKCLQMSAVDEKTVVSFIRENAKRGPLPIGTKLGPIGSYDAGLLTEAKLITDIEDTEICGYKEM